MSVVNIQYIYHSGIFIDTENYNILIDYYLGDLPTFDKKTYIVSTHSHRDHFNPKIMDLEGDISYILSSDIKEEENIDQGPNIHFMEPDQKLDFDGLVIESYGSTDKGISILIKVDGAKIFHAGDLNNWVWPEDTATDRTQMAEDFQHEVDKLIDKEIDILIFPVDSRLDETALLGPRYVLNKLDIGLFLPVHMFNDCSYAKNLEKEFSNQNFFIPQDKNEQYIYKM